MKVIPKKSCMLVMQFLTHLTKPTRIRQQYCSICSNKCLLAYEWTSPCFCEDPSVHLFPGVVLKPKSNLYNNKKTLEVTKCTLSIVLCDECLPLEDAAEHNFGIFCVIVL